MTTLRNEDSTETHRPFSCFGGSVQKTLRLRNSRERSPLIQEALILSIIGRGCYRPTRLERSALGHVPVTVICEGSCAANSISLPHP